MAGITGKPVEQRLAGSLALALAAAAHGAQIVRVHDVAETVDALKVWHAATQLSQTSKEKMTRKYFGTDGVRGLVGVAPITPDFVMRLGYAAGKVLAQAESANARPTVLIGKDTRISGYMLEAALEAGFGRGRRRCDAGRSDADAGRGLSDARAAPVGRRGDFGFA